MSLTFDFALNTALERENVTRDVLSVLRESKTKGMPECITDHQLLLFYVACDRDFEQTKKAIESYYKYKQSVPSFFSDCDPTSEKIQHCLKNQLFFYLPVTPKNFSVIYARLENANPNNFYLETAVKTYLMTVDSCLRSQGPRAGIIFLFDAKHISLGHLKRCKIKTVATFCHFVNDSLAARLEEIHIINTPWYFESIMQIVRPFLKKDRKIFVHGYASDYSEVLKDIIPKDCLPYDLGGTLDTVEELHKQHSERLLKMKTFFANEEKQWKI